MISINNFFGIDLERMPNHKSIYVEERIDTFNKKEKVYSHSISKNTEDYFFKSVDVFVKEDKETGFHFERIPFDKSTAVDIAFIITRDLFNNGKLDYSTYYRKHKKNFDSDFLIQKWYLENGTIFLNRIHDGLILSVYINHCYDRDSEEVIPDSKIAEDGIIEYKFGSDLYPQGCEVLPGEEYYQKPLSSEDYTYRTIKIRVASSDERIGEFAKIWQKSFLKENVDFMGLIMDGAYVFVSPETQVVLPMTQFLDRKNMDLGHRIFASIKRVNSINMDVFIEYILQIVTTKEREESYSIDIETVFENKCIPSYIYSLINQYRPNTQNVEATTEYKNSNKNTTINEGKSKTISISFNEYDLPNAKKEYLKSCANDSSIEFKLSLKKDKRKREYIAVESINSDYPLSTEVKDECLIEDFKKHEQLVQEGKATGKCYGVLFHYQDANSEFSTSQRIFLHIKIYMPWTQYKEIPGVPQTQQETPSLETKNAGIQKYIANLVGFKFCLKEDEMDEVDKYFYDFSNVIYLKPENDNPFDPNAIAAYMDNGKKIAYVAKENAQVLRPLLQEDEEIEAQPERFNFTSAVIRMNLPCNKSLELESLFSEYKPIEVYKAHYLNVYWGGTDSLVERNIFNSNEQSINFENLLSLPIEQQNYLAVEWKDCMNKVSVENPTNFGLKMNVHLDLSIYGSSLGDIDLSDIELLDRIEEDNKKTALFVRLSREKYVSSPKEFIEEHCPDACDTLKQRLQYEYNKISK